jgi:ribosome recycling factor
METIQRRKWKKKIIRKMMEGGKHSLKKMKNEYKMKFKKD